ncbi:hypothetical protein GCM10027418_09930 [Mariniluteicoccus endophyticus]
MTDQPHPEHDLGVDPTTDDFGRENPDPVPEAAPQRAAARSRVPSIVAVAGAGVLVLGVLIGLLMWRLSGGAPEQLQGPDSTPTPVLTPRAGTPAPVVEAKVGQRVPIEGLYGKGTVMVTKYEWSDKGDLPPGQGRNYLNVELRYDCSEGVIQINKNLYAAYDLAKKEYLSGIGSGKEPLPDTELKPGTPPVTGWISMEVPPGQTLFTIADEGMNTIVIVDLPKP